MRVLIATITFFVTAVALIAYSNTLPRQSATLSEVISITPSNTPVKSAKTQKQISVAKIVPTVTPQPTQELKPSGSIMPRPIITQTSTPTFTPTTPQPTRSASTTTPQPTHPPSPTATPTPVPSISQTPEATPSPTTEQQSTSQHVYYTSSYKTAKYYYCDTDNGWKSLSPNNLKSYSSSEALLADYPSRTLHEECK